MSAARPAPRRPIPTGRDLARAIQLFHAHGPWTDEKQTEWNRVTGCPETEVRAMSAVLVDMAHAYLEAEVRIDLAPTAGETR